MWANSTIGELCDQGHMSIQTGPFGSQLHAYDYQPTGVPVIPTEAIGRRVLRTLGLPLVSEETAERLSRHRVRVGDILFARRGVQATGFSAIVQLGQENWICGTGAILLRTYTKLIDPQFLSFWLASDNSINWLKAHAVGAVMPNLNEAVLRGLPITLPPLPEQRAIAAVLGALDEKIELNRRMNATLEQMAQALFKSWFVDFEPVHANRNGEVMPGLAPDVQALFPAAFEDSALGEIPQGWRVRPLSGLAIVVMGASPDGNTYNEIGEGTPLINGPVEFDDYYPLKKKWTTVPTRLSQPGDLIFCVRGSTTGRRVIADDIYCLGRGVCAIRAMRDWQEFTNQTVDFELSRLLTKTTGSVFPNLSVGDIKEFTILIPPNNLIDKFCDLVNPIRAKIESNVQESRTLAATRDALLPKLLSGEVRVREAEKIVESLL